MSSSHNKPLGKGKHSNSTIGGTHNSQTGIKFRTYYKPVPIKLIGKGWEKPGEVIITKAADPKKLAAYRVAQATNQLNKFLRRK